MNYFKEPTNRSYPIPALDWVIPEARFSEILTRQLMNKSAV